MLPATNLQAGNLVPGAATKPMLDRITKWLSANFILEKDHKPLTPEVVGDTLGALLKYQDDIARMQGDALQKVLKETTSES